MMNETQYDAQLFAELYDVQPQAIFWFLPLRNETDQGICDFKFCYANDEGLKYLNLSREQFADLTICNSPTLTQELRDSIFAEMVWVHETGNKSETSIYNTALNKYARVLRTKLRDGILTIVQDITKEKRIIHQLEKQAEQLEQQTKQLKDQKALLDNILENSSNGISVSRVFRNEAGTVIDALTILANDAAVKFIGFPREVYLSKKATEIEPAVMTSPYYKACINTLETGEPFMMQYFMESTKRWLELTVSKMDNDHLIQIFTDVTPIKEAQLQLEKTIEGLKRSNTHLEDFAYAASHDMKEPLRKILTFIDRLKTSLKTSLGEKEIGLFERMETSATRMQLLVDDLLEFSHVSQRNGEPEVIDLNDKLNKVISDLELSIEEKGAKINVGALPSISGNRRQIQQLFQNLISNALKYSKAGVPPEVSIQARLIRGSEAPDKTSAEESNKSFLLIEVTDNGIGFDPQYAERIFEMFQRLHGKMEYAGTGVGLAIAKKVVENHHGYLWATSEPGKGSTFSILLPALTETSSANDY